MKLPLVALVVCVVAGAGAGVGLVASSVHAQEAPVAELEPGGPMLRVQITPLTPQLRQWLGAPKEAGILVGDVRPDGAGARAGLKVGDVITQIDSRRVTDAIDVRTALATHPEGDTVKLAVVRDRKPIALNVVVPKAEPARLAQPLYPQQQPGYRIEPPGPGPHPDQLDRLELRVNQLEQRLMRLESQPR